MAKIKPVGTARHQPSKWRSPSDWRENDIPEVPGWYHVRCVDNSNAPICVPFTPDPGWDSVVRAHMEKVATDLSEVIYIGKAADLRKRFWKELVQSWLPGKAPTDPHPSRKNWNACPPHQSTYPAAGIQCRYFPVGINAMGTAPTDDLAHLMADFFGWIEKDARKTEQLTPAAAATAEKSMLLKYLRVFGHLPPLNIKPPERLGDEVTAAWLHDLFMAEGLDIRFGDAGDQSLKEVIRSLMRRDKALDPCVRYHHQVDAYYHWRNRGSPPGDDWTDWFATGPAK